jgi:hydrogenase maturation protease
MGEAGGRATGESTGRRALVVGLGNLLRTDDGVGFAVVERLDTDPRLTAVRESGRLRVFWAQQLTPELAADFSAVDVVVLVDADTELAPGEVQARRVDAAAAAPGSAGPGMTHHVDAASLAAMARDLYGAAPKVWVVGVGPDSLEVGEALTPVVSAAVPRAVESAVQLLGEDPTS